MTTMLPISPQARVGAVTLAVASLARAVAFYQDVLGFQVRTSAGGSASLGAGGPDLLHLVEQPGARPARGVTGLYHFAVLVPTRLDLARSLRRLAELSTPLQGLSDHGVSEAIYLADPDGNGIEIYRDRPRAEWPRAGREVRMTVDPLDVDSLIDELAGDDEPWAGLRPGTTIGHMHLHVADIAAARQFYVGALGLELMQTFGAADFVAAGGYHHHLGYNIWAGRGAPPPAPDMAGLRRWELLLPDQAALDATLGRLRASGIALEQAGGGALARDPSQNTVLITCPSAPS